MQLFKSLIILLFLIISFSAQGQNDGNVNQFGLKAGINSSKYTPSTVLTDYNNHIGFYAGVFYELRLDERFSFKPELLFSLQGSSITHKDIQINNGNLPFYVEPYDFDFEVYDYVVAIPLTIKYHLIKDLYLGAGPQFNFIIDQTFQTDQQLLDGTGFGRIYEDGENFEFGFHLVLGYDISNTISFQVGAFSAVGNRNNDAKSFVLNSGLEFRL